MVKFNIDFINSHICINLDKDPNTKNTQKTEEGNSAIAYSVSTVNFMAVFAHLKNGQPTTAKNCFKIS